MSASILVVFNIFATIGLLVSCASMVHLRRIYNSLTTSFSANPIQQSYSNSYDIEFEIERFKDAALLELMCLTFIVVLSYKISPVGLFTGYLGTFLLLIYNCMLLMESELNRNENLLLFMIRLV